MRNFSGGKILRIIVLSSLFLWLFFSLAHPNLAFNEDLGRHLALGKIIWETKTVPQTNLFTYTNPNFPFLDHHWLSEVVFYLMNTGLGPLSITLLKILLILGAFLLVFTTAKRTAGFPAAVISGTVFLPLFFERTSERPEIFGYFFFALLIFLFFSGKPGNKKWFFVVPLILAAWVNLHISFVYGVLAVAAFVVAELWRLFHEKAAWRKYLPPALLGAGSAAALFINPHGAAGVFYPFSIFANYGYRIIENQNIFFLIPRISDPILSYFSYFALPVVILFFAFFGIRMFLKKYKHLKLLPNQFALVFISLVSLGLSVWAIRNFPNAAIAGIPAGALLLSMLFPSLHNEELDLGKTSKTSIILFLTTFIALVGSFSILLSRPIALTTNESYKAGVDFFLAHKFPGNVFNDFDIGGYLDYRFYPERKTFVDNRPEAFPVDFFETYRTMQEDPKVRAEVFAKYNIGTIIFSVNDITPWAQDFLGQMVNDKEWKTEYLDPSIIIFSKLKV